ncbi:MAG: RDD family protein [Hyphomonadaceae bacterium]
MLVSCQECSASISASASVCPKCGAPRDVFMGAAAACRECAAEFHPAYQTCQNCGAPKSIALTASAHVGSASHHPELPSILQDRTDAVARAPLYPWARWGAKWIDTAIFAVLLAVALTLLEFDWYSETADALFLFLIVMTFPFWDAVLLSMSGGSPGRAIFRFRVRMAESRGNPNLGSALSRSWGAWFFGCGLGIPLVALVTMLLSRDYLQRYGESRWDDKAKTEVVHDGPRWWSWALFVLAVLGVGVLNVAGQSGY